MENEHLLGKAKYFRNSSPYCHNERLLTDWVVMPSSGQNTDLHYKLVWIVREIQSSQIKNTPDTDGLQTQIMGEE